MLAAQGLEDLLLVGEGRIAQTKAHQKAIELRLGQGEGALVLDGVLGGEHEERAGQQARLAFDRNLVFAHALQQGGLGTGRGAVNLIRQQHVAEGRAGAEVKLLRLLIEDGHADHVVGQQIWGELDALEATANGPRQGLGEHRLADAGHVLN
jgi:hypothetical protein